VRVTIREKELGLRLLGSIIRATIRSDTSGLGLVVHKYLPRSIPCKESVQTGNVLVLADEGLDLGVVQGRAETFRDLLDHEFVTGRKSHIFVLGWRVREVVGIRRYGLGLYRLFSSFCVRSWSRLIFAVSEGGDLMGFLPFKCGFNVSFTFRF